MEKKTCNYVHNSTRTNQRRLSFYLRYGPVFKTSLVGQPVVVSLDPDVNRFIFQQEGKLFRLCYPDTANSIFGKESTSSYDGTLHRYVRSLASRHFGLENLKGAFLAELEGTIADSLRAWAVQPSVEVKDAISNVRYVFFLIDYLNFRAFIWYT